MPRHPNEALFEGEPPMPVIPSCEHFAGTEQRIQKAFELQEQMGGVFDITMDLEDGAPTGEETEHAHMAARMQNSPANKHNMAGVRIHDYTHSHWRADVDIVVGEAAERVAYLTVPKCTEASQGDEMIAYIRERTQQAGVDREIPIHILIETHGALHDAWELAALPNVQVLDFGLMDFVSAHHGTIPAAAMRSPGQFNHQLIRRAKGEVVAAALAHGVVPAHNVTLELRDEEVIYGDARRAREEFGFMRQWSIYPAQIEPITRAMAPEAPEVALGEAIMLKAFEADWGPIQHEGDLHDRATYRYYWEALQRARLMNVTLSDEVEKLFFSGDAS
ncbi:MAG: aldolase/citrate lyase family protein [Chloroflexi bacterium]|nr:aldolase/citrate lyase family protein [Chloroflexota bacterium]